MIDVFLSGDTTLWSSIICVTLVVGLVIAVQDHYANQPRRCSDRVTLIGKTAIVTGASSGVGMETAWALAERGCRVILAAESVKRAQKVADDIIKTTGNDQIVVQHLDSSELTSVRNFAQNILDTENSLHILVNSAKIRGQIVESHTADDLEMTMATNHFGPFLLTNSLLGLLKKSAPSRIVTLSSEGYRFCKSINPEDLNNQQMPFQGPHETYGCSILWLNLCMSELAEMLQGTGVTANCVQPRANGTERYTKGRKKNVHNITSNLYHAICKPEKLESQVVDYLAVSEEVENVSGKYFINFVVSEPSSLSRDKNLAKKIWEMSEEIVRSSPKETK